MLWLHDIEGEGEGEGEVSLYSKPLLLRVEFALLFGTRDSTQGH